MRRDLEAISRTARAMALSMPGLEDKFRSPRCISDQELLATARAFASDALPLQAEFVRRGMPDSFLADLNDDIEEFEGVNSLMIQRQGAHVAATAAIDNTLDRGLTIVREMDAIMRNQFSSDAASLASLVLSCHLSRLLCSHAPQINLAREARGD